MEVPSKEEFNALEKKFEVLETIIKNLTKSPLYLEWVSLNQACKLLGIKTRETVIRMCDDGRLEYKRDGRNYQINYPSIVELNKRNTIRR
jgi:excisionase family DNA binding protein